MRSPLFAIVPSTCAFPLPRCTSIPSARATQRRNRDAGTNAQDLPPAALPGACCLRMGNPLPQDLTPLRSLRSLFRAAPGQGQDSGPRTFGLQRLPHTSSALHLSPSSCAFPLAPYPWVDALSASPSRITVGPPGPPPPLRGGVCRTARDIRGLTFGPAPATCDPSPDRQAVLAKRPVRSLAWRGGSASGPAGAAR